jgi:hypothetical protein
MDNLEMFLFHIAIGHIWILAGCIRMMQHFDAKDRQERLERGYSETDFPFLAK